MFEFLKNQMRKCTYFLKCSYLKIIQIWKMFKFEIRSNLKNVQIFLKMIFFNVQIWKLFNSEKSSNFKFVQI
jgi:hypothetical protein